MLEEGNVIEKKWQSKNLTKIFGTEQISKDIGWFIDNRFALVTQVAAYKFAHGLKIEDIGQEQKILYSLKLKADMLNLTQPTISDLMQLQIEASKIIQGELLSRWSSSPVLAPKLADASEGIEKIRLLISNNDNALLNYFASTTFLKGDILNYILDFHFEHPYINDAINKKMKILFCKLMLDQLNEL